VINRTGHQNLPEEIDSSITWRGWVISAKSKGLFGKQASLGPCPTIKMMNFSLPMISVKTIVPKKNSSTAKLFLKDLKIRYISDFPEDLVCGRRWFRQR